jgi:hypothetical protein
VAIPAPTQRRPKRRTRTGILVLALTTAMAVPCLVASDAGAATTASSSSSDPLAPVLSEVQGQLAFVMDAVENLGPFLQCLDSYTGAPEPGCYEGPP